ncbi:MAG TPA: xanthine dehydrogenase family protein subunit M [Acetobacteraceae bacterium]
MYDFAYQKPSSLAEAVKALSADPEAKALAGGMTLIPVLKQRLNKPSLLVDLAKLGLTGVSFNNGIIIIGGMTTHGAVSGNAEVQSKLPSLAELASHIGDEAVRHRGTIGGSLANNDPAADYPAAVLALNATIKTDRRSIKADDFFQGMFATALEQGELITSVEFPVPEKGAYQKFPNPASRYAIVGVYVAKTANGVRVAVTGAGQNGVFRHTAMEQALTANFSPDAIASIATPADDLNSDIHASAEYRAHLVGVMARRAVARA